ncbi:MAG: hypothetical protein R3B70_42990 [Polyangiaceae bacterium]
MNKRSIGWVLTGLFLAGVSVLVAPGCSRSVAGEAYRICTASCEAGDDCEDYTKIPVDREDCIADCDKAADDEEEKILDKCERGVNIDGGQVDRCLDAINRFGQVCRDDDESELLEAVGDIGDECKEGDLYDCN